MVGLWTSNFKKKTKKNPKLSVISYNQLEKYGGNDHKSLKINYIFTEVEF